MIDIRSQYIHTPLRVEVEYAATRYDEARAAATTATAAVAV